MFYNSLINALEKIITCNKHKKFFLHFPIFRFKMEKVERIGQNAEVRQWYKKWLWLMWMFRGVLSSEYNTQCMVMERNDCPFSFAWHPHHERKFHSLAPGRTDVIPCNISLITLVVLSRFLSLHLLWRRRRQALSVFRDGNELSYEAANEFRAWDSL